MRSMILNIKAAMVITLIALSTGFAAVDDAKVTAHDMLAKAAETFSQANQNTGQKADELYLEAASLYEQAADAAGVKNAKLYYNIANSYLLAGKLGEAIYNYKLALRLDPSDPLLQRNLAVARSKRLDKVDTQIENKVLSRLCFWHYDFSLRTRFYTAIAFFAVLMLLFTLKVWLPSVPGFMPAGIVCGIVFLCMAGSVAVEVVHNKTHQQGVIVAGEVVARKGDSDKYEPSFKDPLHSGTEFELLEKRPDWLKVRLTDGSQVWLPESACLL